MYAGDLLKNTQVLGRWMNTQWPGLKQILVRPALPIFPWTALFNRWTGFSPSSSKKVLDVLKFVLILAAGYSSNGQEPVCFLTGPQHMYVRYAKDLDPSFSTLFNKNKQNTA